MYLPGTRMRGRGPEGRWALGGIIWAMYVLIAFFLFCVVELSLTCFLLLLVYSIVLFVTSSHPMPLAEEGQTYVCCSCRLVAEDAVAQYTQVWGWR